MVAVSIKYDEKEFKEALRVFEGMPGVWFGRIMGPGLVQVEKKVAALAQATAPRSEDEEGPLTKYGKPRMHMADSFKVRRIPWTIGGRKIRGAGAKISFYQPHAHLVEFGTYKMDPRPFLENANNAIAPQATAIIKKVVDRNTRRIVKQLRKGVPPKALARAIAEDLSDL